MQPNRAWGDIMAFFDEIPVGGIRDVYAYWLGKRRNGRLPLKQDIDPIEFKPHWLPDLFMYRFEDGRFRCILVGTRIVQVRGRDETGMFLDEVLPREHAASRQRLFERAARDRVPVFYSGPSLDPSREFPRVSRLLLPVSSDGIASDHVFGIARYEKSPGRELRPGTPSSRAIPARIVVATQEDLAAAPS